ncbi:hypothetical protein [Geminocystis sp. NIES-3709]|uniref:hypothetical protein n=1 Tax=Geminocystis sp. NIES-3709 TaxID=1617448 RepID=UPI0005FC4BD5|nr:hypothetical protein [Geminocystis sp. NIES-3709]BAQ66892.1 hypothetical protein GM3709_3657 [Geminocystis sp. NIES-3709]
MNKPLTIKLDLPSEWLDKIENLAKEKQQPLDQLITDILGQYLGYNLENTRLDRLEKQHQDLTNRLETLEDKDYQLEKLQYRFEIIEKLIASLQTQVISRPLDLINHSLMIEEVEDEPDEILTDFLQ